MPVRARPGCSAFRGKKSSGTRSTTLPRPASGRRCRSLWRAFLEHGEQEGTLQLVGPDGTPREVEYTAKGNVLPVRHAVVLRDKTAPAAAGQTPIPSWVQDYALYLLDIEGRVVAWYSGAARIYGYQADEVIGQHVSFLYPGRRYASGQPAGGVQARRGRRPYGNRRLAEPKGRDRDSGPTPLRWRSKTRTENCRVSRGWCAILAIVTSGTRSCCAAARGSGRSHCNRRSPAWFPVSSIAFPR